MVCGLLNEYQAFIPGKPERGNMFGRNSAPGGNGSEKRFVVDEVEISACAMGLGQIALERLSFPRFFVCQRVGFMLPVFPDAAL